MAYVLEFVDELNEEDEVFEHAGVKVIIDQKSLVYLDGTELDYVKQGLNEALSLTTLTPKASVVVVRALTSSV